MATRRGCKAMLTRCFRARLSCCCWSGSPLAARYVLKLVCVCVCVFGFSCAFLCVCLCVDVLVRAAAGAVGVIGGSGARLQETADAVVAQVRQTAKAYDRCCNKTGLMIRSMVYAAAAREDFVAAVVGAGIPVLLGPQMTILQPAARAVGAGHQKAVA